MESDRQDAHHLLFVCLGNICRSPLAEGVFRHLAEEAGVGHFYRIDSAGTGGWHVGAPPDPRSIEVAHRNGIHLSGTARKVSPDDFEEFDLLIAMDRENLRDLREIAATHGPSGSAGSKAAIHLMREFDDEASDELDVPDPYYGGPEGFDRVFELVERSCRALLEELEASRTRSR